MLLNNKIPPNGNTEQNSIEKWKVAHLSTWSRGFEPTAPIMNEAIFYRLKTGCQWRDITTKEFFRETIFHGIAFIITSISGQKQVIDKLFGSIYLKTITLS